MKLTLTWTFIIVINTFILSCQSIETPQLERDASGIRIDIEQPHYHDSKRWLHSAKKILSKDGQSHFNQRHKPYYQTHAHESMEDVNSLTQQDKPLVQVKDENSDDV